MKGYLIGLKLRVLSACVVSLPTIMLLGQAAMHNLTHLPHRGSNDIRMGFSKQVSADSINSLYFYLIGWLSSVLRLFKLARRFIGRTTRKVHIHLDLEDTVHSERILFSEDYVEQSKGLFMEVSTVMGSLTAIAITRLERFPALQVYVILAWTPTLGAMYSHRPVHSIEYMLDEALRVYMKVWLNLFVTLLLSLNFRTQFRFYFRSRNEPSQYPSRP
jgi:hypothetical protein